MIEFKTTFVPPTGEEAHPEWGTRLDAANKVFDNEGAAREFVDSIPDRYHMLVAYAGDRAIGLQVLDWDEYDMDVHIGRHALAHDLTDVERDGLGDALEKAARGRGEDIF